MVDFFETPAVLADAMLALVENAPKVVADLAAGHGLLLERARLRWGRDVDLVAADIDPMRVREVGDRVPDAKLFVYDTARGLPVAVDAEIRRTRPDLVLLNPPYSYRGNKRCEFEYRGGLYRASPALGFVARAVRLAGEGGVVVALVPRNVLLSDRDRLLRDELVRTAGFRHRLDVERGEFPGVHARLAIVTARPGAAAAEVPIAHRQRDGRPVLRGSLPMYRANATAVAGAGSRRLLHTTDLRSLPKMPDRWVLGGRHVSGHGVLLPRVGFPSASAIVALELDEAVLSDCLFFIPAESAQAAESLAQLLVERVDDLRGIYAGSCAPYVTSLSLSQWLAGAAPAGEEERLSVGQGG